MGFAVVASCLLSACQRASGPSLYPSMDVLPHKGKDASDRMMSKVNSRLEQIGVRVISMGDDHLIAVPAKMLFKDQSPQIDWHAYALLNDLACLLRQYQKISIQVSVFTSCSGSLQRQEALSRARARAVADYLWSQGLDSRMIFVYGGGSRRPVLSRTTRGDGSGNSRVEITFRRVEA